MITKESLNTRFDLRFAVIIADTNLVTGETHKTDLKFFDEYSDACEWIKEHGSMYGKSESDKKGYRFFRIEKRYYVI